MEAGDRDAVVNEFREGVTKILIATDVLSRGFDVSQVGRGMHAGGCIAGHVGVLCWRVRACCLTMHQPSSGIPAGKCMYVAGVHH